MRVKNTVLLALGLLSASCCLGQTTTDSALSFNGTSDVVVVSNSPLFELTSGTLEGWFRPDWAPGSLNYDPVLIANQFGPSLTRYSLRLDRNLGGVILANGSSTSMVPYSFNRGRWVHLAVAASGTTAQVYVNGLPVGATSNGFGTLIGLPLNLGSDGVGGFFPGQMDEVRIWNTTQVAADIRYNVSRALAGTEPGLVAYWRFAEGFGLVANDATSNGLNGLLNGATWTNSDVVLVNTSGSFGMALDFCSSRGSYVQVPPAASLTLSNQFTFEAWIKPRTATCNTILAQGDGLNLTNTDYIFQVGSDGTNRGVMKLALMVARNWATSISAVPLNAWAHVAVSYDGAAARFYINGLLDAAVPLNGSANQTGLPVLMGRQGVSGANYFDGILDEVRVWNVVRSDSEIQTNLNRSVAPNQPSLVGYWRFDEQSGAAAVDSSGRLPHGSLVNRPLRIAGFWAPMISLNGANPTPLECHANYSDPGATLGCVPVAVWSSQNAIALRPDGSAVGWGYNAYGQNNIPAGATNLVALSSSTYHSLGLRADGSVLGWGDNTSGQTIIPASATNVVGIAASSGFEGNLFYACSIALKADGSIIGWGSDHYQQLDIPSAATNIVAISASAYGGHCLALRADGGVVQWGANNNGQGSPPPATSGAVAVAAGGYFSLALKPNRTVVGWGANNVGQINIPAGAINVVAIAAGYEHALALRLDGTVVTWGSNLGPIPSGATNIIAIAAGANFSVALRADGAIFAWGSNFAGNTTPPPNVNVPTLPVLTRGAVNSNTPGRYSVMYVGANSAGGTSTALKEINVVDTTPPVMALRGPNPLRVDIGSAFLDPGAAATDACSGDLTASITRTGSVNNNLPGAYTLTYTATDPSGNVASTNRTVLVTGAPTVLSFNAFLSGTNAVTGSAVVQFVAEVNPNGLPTATVVQYGLATTYPGRTTVVNLTASYNSSSYFATLDGLLPGATYHFRIAATNSLGVTYGPDQTFTVPMVFGPGDLNGDGHVSQGELLSVVSNFFNTTTDRLIMTNSISLGGGLFQFGLTNNSGWNFSILVSTNLIDWSPLPVTAQPVWQFLDPDGTNQPRRFYRVRWP
jgi:alpha-tubulin suppressor-like RCC1 family protein